MATQEHIVTFDLTFDGDHIVRDVVARIADSITERGDHVLRKMAMRLIRDRLKDTIDQYIVEVLSSTIQQTTAFGEPKGEPMSMRDYVVAICRESLAEKVDRCGKPTSGYNNRNAVPRVAHMCKSLYVADTEEIIKNAVAVEIETLKGSIAAGLRVEMAKAVNAVLGANILPTSDAKSVKQIVSNRGTDTF